MGAGGYKGEVRAKLGKMNSNLELRLGQLLDLTVSQTAPADIFF